MKKQFSFEITGYCVGNESDWGEPITVEEIQQDVEDLLEHYLCLGVDIIVTNLERNKIKQEN